jgi:hypothetical protein
MRGDREREAGKLHDEDPRHESKGIAPAGSAPDVVRAKLGDEAPRAGAVGDRARLGPSKAVAILGGRKAELPLEGAAHPLSGLEARLAGDGFDPLPPRLQRDPRGSTRAVSA